MVGTDNSRLDFEHFAWQLHNRDSMNAPVEIKQQESLQRNINCGNCILPTCVGGMQGFAIPPLPSFKVEQLNVVQESRQCLPPHFQNSLGTPMPWQKGKESMHYAHAGPSGMPVSKSNNGSYPKGFLIFDQSGNQKRLMYAPMCPPVYIPSTFAETKRCGWLEEEGAAGDIDSVKYFPNTLSNENYVADGESEMHENTEEIDALLYSDYDCTSCSSDDEVTSTGHSPEMIHEHCEKEEQCQETTTEAASSNGPRKRQRVHDGGYVKSLPSTTASSARVELQKIVNDAESSCGMVHEEEAGTDVDFCHSSCKKDRIKETLRVLESLVPDAKGKDPLLVIDEAIDYLKSLKHEASALGVSCY
ncbi:transcription factor bHLH143-like [Cucurbita moschata]|uniref:Transcription factor bHLH143-like n=1 Tax=Cucurbita moschata TaxID=3662 RepID=A0A6J1E8Z4_CUCMO|nr:transcription factor bHLH143-like [Cucurbita moschata]